MKKRKILLAWIALELTALPVAAHIFNQVDFSKPQKPTVAEIFSDTGSKTFMAHSTAPFAITAKGSAGLINISVSHNGLINGNPYGENAQLPGKSFKCAQMTSDAPVNIYQSHRKTQIKRGPILTQAVRIDVTYDPEMTPEFEFISVETAQNIARAPSCDENIIPYKLVKSESR